MTETTAKSRESLLEGKAIAALIPHSGNMCLLNSVLAWDEQHIEALVTDVHSARNPLRENGELHTIVLVEYAAQAAAVHAALSGGGMVGDVSDDVGGVGSISGERAAYIGSIKAMTLHEPTVDRSENELLCNAQCLLNNTNGAIYQLTVCAQEKKLMEARLVLILPK